MIKILLLSFLKVVISIQANTLDVVFEHNPPFQMIDEHGKGHSKINYR